MATTAVVPRAAKLPEAMTGMLKELMPDVSKLLPADIPFERFRAALWLELTGRASLKDCPPHTIRDAAIKAATMGFMPGRDGHILPFRNKRANNRQEAQWVTNYFGVCLALRRTGLVDDCFAHPVYEGDEFVFDYFAEKYVHIPYMVRGAEPGKVKFYYGAVKLKDAPPHVEPMSLDQIEAIRKRAPAHESGPWVSDYVEMARKTAMKRCAKYVRLPDATAAFFAEEEERDRDDIPPERHKKNVGDLFGDMAADAIDVTPTPTSSLWRETLEAHWESAPKDLKERCRVALENAETPEHVGFALASELLDWLDSHAPEDAV